MLRYPGLPCLSSLSLSLKWKIEEIPGKMYETHFQIDSESDQVHSGYSMHQTHHTYLFKYHQMILTTTTIVNYGEGVIDDDEVGMHANLDLQVDALNRK